MPRRRLWMTRPKRRPLLKLLVVAGLAAGASLAATGAAAGGYEPTRHPAQRPHALQAFEVVGAPVTLVAYGRGVYADEIMRARCEEARNLRKAMDGFPAESSFNVALRMTF